MFFSIANDFQTISLLGSTMPEPRILDKRLDYRMTLRAETPHCKQGTLRGIVGSERTTVKAKNTPD